MRYTIKMLDELSDLKFARLILQERLNGLTNPYSPLSSKLRQTINTLAELELKQPAPPEPQKQYSSLDEVFDDLNWHFHRCSDGSVELESWSPAGENIVVDIEGKDIPAEVAEYAEDFDPDEHAEMWVEGRGKRGVPSSIRELIDDANDIKEMLKTLADALATVPVEETNCEAGTYDCDTCISNGDCPRKNEEDEDDD